MKVIFLVQNFGDVYINNFDFDIDRDCNVNLAFDVQFEEI